MKAAIIGLVGMAWITGFLALAHAEDEPPEIAQGFTLLRLDGHLVRWPQTSPAGTPRSISYRVLSEAAAFPDARNCRSMIGIDAVLTTSSLARSTFETELEAAFAQWEAVTNLRFTKARDGEAAQILVGAQLQPEGWAYANISYDERAASQYKPITQALICLNPTRPWKVGFDGKLEIYDLRYTLAHEIGHAIGLDHPPRGGQIMAQRYAEASRELQQGDIRGAIALYGPPSKSARAALPTLRQQDTLR